MNQILVLVIIRRGLAELLCDPESSRVPSDITVQNSPPVMRNHEEAVQDAEGDCWNREEIHRSDGFAVIVNEGLPTSYWFWVLRSFLYPTRHSSFREVESQFQEFSVNTRSAPGGDQFQNQQRATKRLFLVVPLSLAIIVALLQLTFGSIKQTLLVLCNVPFALVGGIAALWLRGSQDCARDTPGHIYYA